jgi:hypothetical protein
MAYIKTIGKNFCNKMPLAELRVGFIRFGKIIIQLNTQTPKNFSMNEEKPVHNGIRRVNAVNWLLNI